MRWLIGFPAGGPVDTVARIMSQALSEHLGQQFVVENRAGSGGNIATEAGVNATPDGYTLMFSGANNAISASLYKNLPFDFIRDTVPVAFFTQVPNLLVVSNALPVKTVQELIDYCKAKSRQAVLCLLGQRHHAAHVGGTVQGDDQVRHAACALSRIGGRLSRRHLQQGAADLRQSADRDGAGAERQRARARRHLAAALAQPARRSRGRRDRAGLSRRLCSTACPRPRARRREIVAILNKAVNEVLKDPKLIARFATLGGVPQPMTPEGYGKLIADETEKWRKVVAFAGVSVE